MEFTLALKDLNQMQGWRLWQHFILRITFAFINKWTWGFSCACQLINIDKLMMKFIINTRTDAQKGDVNLFFTITKQSKWFIAGLNWGEETQKTALKMKFIHIDANIVNSLIRFLNGFLQQSIKFHFALKWSSGWPEYREILLLATDVSETCAEAIFRVKR